MNFRKLQIFQAVIKGGSASRASELLDISQPAVSRSIAELELSLGFQLFNRIKGRLAVTPEGELFSKEVETAFLAMDRLKTASLKIRDYGSGHIKIASLAAMGSTLVPRAIQLFKQDYAKVAITLDIGSTAGIRDLVAHGQFDLGIVADEVNLTGLDHMRFASFEAVCVIPTNHPLVHQRTVLLEHLHQQPFIALSAGDKTREALDMLFEEHGVEPDIRIETPNSSTICALALEGAGIGVINPIAADGFAERGLVIRPLSSSIYFKSHLIFRPDVQKSTIVSGMTAALMRARNLPPTNARSVRNLK